jgi:hypothetical protein
VSVAWGIKCEVTVRAERTLNLGAAFIGWVALALIGGCSDSSGPCLSCSPPSQGLIVSRPVPVAGVAARTGAQGLADGARDSVVYVSLRVGPGAVVSYRIRATNRAGDSAPSNVAYGRACDEAVDVESPCFP